MLLFIRSDFINFWPIFDNIYPISPEVFAQERIMNHFHDMTIIRKWRMLIEGFFGQQQRQTKADSKTVLNLNINRYTKVIKYFS